MSVSVSVSESESPSVSASDSVSSHFPSMSRMEPSGQNLDLQPMSTKAHRIAPVLCIANLLGVLEWSWWWIAAPLWLPAIVMFSFVAGRVVAIELELGGWKKKDGWQ